MRAVLLLMVLIFGGTILLSGANEYGRGEYQHDATNSNTSDPIVQLLNAAFSDSENQILKKSAVEDEKSVEYQTSHLKKIPEPKSSKPKTVSIKKAKRKFECYRGILCTLDFTRVVPKINSLSQTFILQTFNGSETWMSNTGRRSFIGIPMVSGTFDYQLSYSRRMNRHIEIPFEVKVKNTTSHNHHIQLILKRPGPTTFFDFPRLRVFFVNALSSALNIPAEEINLENIGTFNGNTSIALFHANLSSEYCDLGNLTETMSEISSRGKPSEKFYGAMGPNFLISFVSLSRFGACIIKTSTMISTTTLNTTMNAMNDDAALWFLTVILALIFFCLFLAAVFDFARRHPGRNNNDSEMELLNIEEPRYFEHVDWGIVVE